MAIYAVHRTNDKTPYHGHRIVLIVFIHYFPIVLVYRKLFKNTPSTENVVKQENNPTVKLESSSETVTKDSEQKVSTNAAQQTTFSLYKIALYVWLAGVIILAVITFITNRRLYAYIKKQPDITDELVVTVFNRCKQSMKIKKAVSLRLAGKIASPTVFSFLRPKVLLSKTYESIK